MNAEIYTKVYVQVNVQFRENGIMLPREIIWEDGVRYEIDRVTDIRQAAAMKAGGQGDRYTIMVHSADARNSFRYSRMFVVIKSTPMSISFSAVCGSLHVQQFTFT